MVITLSILATALISMILACLFAPLPATNRQSLRTVLTSAAIVCAVGMGGMLALFLASLINGNEHLAELGMQPLRAAVALPLISGMAAALFGLMAMMWPAVFERSNDRFAASLYVIIFAAILIACITNLSNLHTDWAGYALALTAVPLIPSLSNRRRGRSAAELALEPKPRGFGSKGADRWSSTEAVPATPHLQTLSLLQRGLNRLNAAADAKADSKGQNKARQPSASRLAPAPRHQPSPTPRPIHASPPRPAATAIPQPSARRTAVAPPMAVESSKTRAPAGPRPAAAPAAHHPIRQPQPSRELTRSTAPARAATTERNLRPAATPQSPRLQPTVHVAPITAIAPEAIAMAGPRTAAAPSAAPRPQPMIRGTTQTRPEPILAAAASAPRRPATAMPMQQGISNYSAVRSPLPDQEQWIDSVIKVNGIAVTRINGTLSNLPAGHRLPYQRPRRLAAEA